MFASEDGRARVPSIAYPDALSVVFFVRCPMLASRRLMSLFYPATGSASICSCRFAKDMIIESLLKQIHNPYPSAPMATSATDKNRQNIIAWLECMQVNTGVGGSDAEDGADMNDPTERGSVGVQQTDDDELLRDAEDKLCSLPDASVPICLLANLSLNSLIIP
ncbi:hypothetical protein A0H81_13811 [Grifola frondosa]|uniref:Uncharacterized protein n=1 Tax=Grifola frondosa TaxID=5627 RepID=A0A1C7LQJ3_GRIFR|nr:hypothetical protein A0H81_13811 [Grifola frondosa]